MSKTFPNGFTSWAETHFEIAGRIWGIVDQGIECTNVELIEAEKGIGGLYEYAEELTDRFEAENGGVAWGEDEEYFKALEDFLHKTLWNQ